MVVKCERLQLFLICTPNLIIFSRLCLKTIRKTTENTYLIKNRHPEWQIVILVPSPMQVPASTDLYYLIVINEINRTSLNTIQNRSTFPIFKCNDLIMRHPNHSTCISIFFEYKKKSEQTQNLIHFIKFYEIKAKF